MGTDGEISGKLYYSMGEVAEMLDVNQSLLRFWEQKFDIIKPKKNRKGNRMFTPADVRNLKMIYHLVKERGMTLAGAQKYMKVSRKDIQRDMELAERLQAIRSLLLDVRQQLGSYGSIVDEIAEPTDIFAECIAEDYPTIPEEEIPMATASSDAAKNSVDKEPATEELIEQLNEEPDEIPDFDPVPGFEPEPEENDRDSSKPEPPKPLYIEQTLF